jgi:hypothetical protein
MRAGLIAEVRIEVKDLAGLGLRHYWDTVVRCLLGLY